MINVGRVVEKDSEVIFRWRNDDLTREMFRSSELVEWDGTTIVRTCSPTPIVVY